MPSRDPVERFEDILENIILIEEFTRGMDLAAFTQDAKTRARRSGASNESVRRQTNLAMSVKSSVRRLRGRGCAPWATSCGMNTTKLRLVACG